MSIEFIIGLGQEGILTAAYMAGPMLLLALVVGLIVSVFQSVTQLNEQTLTFLPKIVAAAIGGLLFAPWMLERVITFTANIIGNLENYIR